MIKLNDIEFGMIKKIGSLLKKLSLILTDEKHDKEQEALNTKNKSAHYRTSEKQEIFDNDGI